jgi:hypothetical protein
MVLIRQTIPAPSPAHLYLLILHRLKCGAPSYHLQQSVTQMSVARAAPTAQTEGPYLLQCSDLSIPLLFYAPNLVNYRWLVG